MFLSKRWWYAMINLSCTKFTNTILTYKLYFRHFHFHVRRTCAYPHEKALIKIIIIIIVITCIIIVVNNNIIIVVVLNIPQFLRSPNPHPLIEVRLWMSGMTVGISLFTSSSHHQRQAFWLSFEGHP